jgi:hypothetical protein
VGYPLIGIATPRAPIDNERTPQWFGTCRSAYDIGIRIGD